MITFLFLVERLLSTIIRTLRTIHVASPGVYGFSLLSHVCLCFKSHQSANACLQDW